MSILTQDNWVEIRARGKFNRWHMIDDNHPSAQQIVGWVEPSETQHEPIPFPAITHPARRTPKFSGASQ